MITNTEIRKKRFSRTTHSNGFIFRRGKIFIGGIGWDTTEERLKDHFSRYGEVSHTMIMRDRITAHPRGFGFSSSPIPPSFPPFFSKPTPSNGRTVEAKRAMSREQQQTLKSGSTSSAGGNFGGSENLKTKKIFVGGLPSTLHEDEFREYFQDFGNVTDVVIMYDPNTGRPRGLVSLPLPQKMLLIEFSIKPSMR
ncbi:UNVERIFIED_CONTAM: Heterogeneous nuclear ribonucleoprotein 1 [Sesamum latifolium]|uniref:Heterogeneous nuclear ribonucleoprotein 1 n=1 Tax=Sesamum latifolium TaxID=2727402 RepID=A0AAW2SGR0_9LAMI